MVSSHTQPNEKATHPNHLGRDMKRFCWFSAQANPPCPPVVLLHHRAGYVHCKRLFQFCRTTNLGIGDTVIVQKVHSGSRFRGVFTFTHEYFTAVRIQLARCPHHHLQYLNKVPAKESTRLHTYNLRAWSIYLVYRSAPFKWICQPTHRCPQSTSDSISEYYSPLPQHKPTVLDMYSPRVFTREKQQQNSCQLWFSVKATLIRFPN